MPLEILKKYWKYNEFRPQQQQIVEAAIDRKDVFALLPTGGGKSICYQVPAMALPGFCLVISPLVALMYDQVMRLKSLGIPATYFHAAQSKKEMETEWQNLQNGKYKFAYISPERVQSERFITHLPHLNINLVAVDEAHCISQWGYDFRPTYQQIKTIRSVKPDVPFMAVTASATPEVQLDILTKLELRNPVLFKASFHRSNLNYLVQYSEDKRKAILNQAKRNTGSGIVYAGSRAKVVELTNWLRQEGVFCEYYHAGLTAEIRSQKQMEWLAHKFPLMVTTNAFGMGIDKPDVRYVVHFSPPNSLEAYYQEAGRAGRDGKEANCILLYDQRDLDKDRINLAEQFPKMEALQKVYEALANHVQLALHSGLGATFPFDLGDFCAKFNFRPLEAHYALKQLEMLGYIQQSEGLMSPSRIKVRMNSIEIYDFQLRYERFEPLIKFLLRAYGGIYDTFVPIQESKIATKINLKPKQVDQLLEELHQLKVVYYVKSSDKPMLTFIVARVQQIEDSQKILKHLEKSAQKRLDKIQHFMESESCRAGMICSYFGEDNLEDCGKCDVCRLKRRNSFSKSTFKQASEKIELLLNESPTSAKIVIDNLHESLNLDVSQAVDLLRWLMDDGTIEINGNRELIWVKK